MASPPVQALFNIGYSGLGVILLTILSLFTTQVSAALITTYSNCLSDTVQESPTHLQFHPLAVDARIAHGDLYTLNVTLYGNVTGSSSRDPRGVTKRSLPGLDPRGLLGRRRIALVESMEDTGFMDVKLEEKERWGTRHSLSRRAPVQYETTGEILSFDERWATNTQTTLKSTVSVLTFTLFDGFSPFCNSAKKECPMKSVLLRYVASRVH